MKTKVLVILAVVISVLLGSLYISSRIIQNQNRTISRLEQNQENLLTHVDGLNVVLQLTKKEFKESLSRALDSTLKANGIKPGQVTDITNIYNTYNNYDTTVIHPEQLIQNKDTTYPFIDIKDCFTIAGFMRVVSEQPILTITERNYSDSISIIGHWKRPHKFLFIEWGKKEYFVEPSSKCGGVTVSKINIVKEKKE